MGVRGGIDDGCEDGGNAYAAASPAMLCAWPTTPIWEEWEEPQEEDSLFRTDLPHTFPFDLELPLDFVE